MAKKRNEVFYRLNKDGLESILMIEKNLESIYNLGNDNRDLQSHNTDQTTKTLVTTKQDQKNKIEVSDKTDFILIDLRDEAAFEKYRIVEGRHILECSRKLSSFSYSEGQISTTDVYFKEQTRQANHRLSRRREKWCQLCISFI